MKTSSSEDQSIVSNANQSSPKYYHGTKANMKLGDLIEPGFNSNYGTRKKAAYIYLTATLDAATWGAELAQGENPGRIYMVEPTGPIEDDPNLTDKKFPGNPTRSYRSKSPLRIIGEVSDWQGHAPEQLSAMKEHLERLKQLRIEAIEDWVEIWRNQHAELTHINLNQDAMSEFVLPYFGKINIALLDEYYDIELDFGSNKIHIDLNFENKIIDKAEMQIVRSFIENVSELDKKNKIYIREDYNDEDGDTVKFYLKHHIEEVSEEELSDLIDFKNKSDKPEIQLLDKLHLVRVGFYPDSEEIFSMFDYSIGQKVTNYLVVIK